MLSVAKGRERERRIAYTETLLLDLLRAQEPLPSRHVVPTISTLRATNLDRVDMLRAVLASLATAGIAPHSVRLADASPAPYCDYVRSSAEAHGMGYHAVDGGITRGIARLLEDLDSEAFFLQFDDILTTNLSDEFLRDSSSLLRVAGAYLLVAPQWAFDVAATSDAISVIPWCTTFVRDQTAFTFRDQAVQQIPVMRVTFGVTTFGIFRNFGYGFFFNNLVASRSEFLSRLRWYTTNVSHDAHAIEVEAASKSLGPYWTHIAIPLSGQSLVDLDYRHTSAALRPEAPELRELVRHLQNGAPISVIVPRV